MATMASCLAAHRIDINGDPRVWSLWSQISVTKHIDKIFEQFLSTWLPPFFLLPQLPLAIQRHGAPSYVQRAVASSAACDALPNVPQIARMQACTTEREHESDML